MQKVTILKQGRYANYAWIIKKIKVGGTSSWDQNSVGRNTNGGGMYYSPRPPLDQKIKVRAFVIQSLEKGQSSVSP